MYALKERIYFTHPIICKALFLKTDGPVLLVLARALTGYWKLDERG